MAEITQQEVAVLRAAEQWWASKTWRDDVAHLETPLVNCVSPEERELAQAVAVIVQAKFVEIDR